MVVVTYPGVRVYGNRVTADTLRKIIGGLKGYVPDVAGPSNNKFTCFGSSRLVIKSVGGRKDIQIIVSNLEEALEVRDSLNRGINGLDLK